MGVGGQRQAPAALPAGERPGTHCTGHELSVAPPHHSMSDDFPPVLKRSTREANPSNLVTRLRMCESLLLRPSSRALDLL